MLGAFHVYVVEPAPGTAPNYVELAGCGPTTTSYERGGVSVEGCLTRSLTFSFGRG